MDMMGFLGKKVDLVLKDGECLSGYVFDVLEADDSGSGCDCIELSPLDRMYLIEIPITDIKTVKVDERYRKFDFRNG